MAAISATVLSWIKTEVDHTLTVVRDSIAQFSAAPEDATALEVCPDQLHQVSGALRIVGLSGATRFCEAIEGTFSGLDNGRPSWRTIGVIDRAVVALKDFVDHLARGQANVPLRLFPVYRELTTLQGKRDTSERDLFFPDLALPTPAHPHPRSLRRGELPAHVQAQRVRFQRGLLAWLRNQPAGLQEMHQALDALHQVAHELPEPRALWWAGCGMFEGLLTAPDPDWLGTARTLCNKLDFQMRDIASAPRSAIPAGSRTASDALLRELLYAVAKCKPSTARIKEIKRLYQLDSLFPDPDLPGALEYDMDWLQPALDEVRSRLAALEGEWLLYVSGETEGAARFRELVASFKAKANELGNPQLERLLDVMTMVSARLPDGYPRQKNFMVIEMASAFLLVESIIENFTSPPDDLQQQIGIMGGWLLDAAKGRSTGQPPAGLRADLTQQIGALQLRAQVAKEILTNLQHVEQVLDAFARDPSGRDTLPGLKPYLRQIHGALVILDFDLAMEVTSICDFMIGECARPDHPRVAQDMDSIAEGLSSLVYFLEPCLHGREPADQAITLFFERFNLRRVPAADPAPHAEPAAPVEGTGDMPASIERFPDEPLPGTAPAPAALAAEPSAPPAPAANQELLAIYLVEAGEVLANIAAAIPMCREHPHDRDALAIIRRGFHTLKGSGRMVQLTEFGEIAWEIEQVLNRYLEMSQPATAGLLELIAAGSAAFANGISRLRAGEPLALHAGHIVDLARRLKSPEEPSAEPAAQAAAGLAAPEPAAPVPESPAAEPEDVTIGGVRLTRAFFEIYLKEAAQHAAALEAEFNGWRTAPGTDASHAFLRAAHTLASSSRTAGFSAIADLAGAVENWIPFARQVTQAGDAHTVRVAIAELRKMVAAVTHRKAPWPAKEPARQLGDLIAKLQATPPPPVESMPRAVEAETAPPAPLVPAPAAGAQPVLRTGREMRTMFDDLDEQLLPIFLEEAQELVPTISADLREWKSRPRDLDNSQSLRRALHTLKGSARMAGAIRLGELTHIMESRVQAAIEAGKFPPALFEDLESKMDRLSFDVERMGLDLERTRSIQGVPPLPSAGPSPAAPRIEVAREAPPLPAPASTLRINADVLDHLISASGEVSIARSRIEAELRLARQSLSELNDSIARLRRQLREIEIQADSQVQSRLSAADERHREFDPLEFDRYTRLQELTRMMAESVHDAAAIQQTLLKNVVETDAALLQQSRISRDVQQELLRMRAVPFSNLNERLHRTVRQAAREVDKRARLEIEESHVELDRGVLDRIVAPLDHMLRNALAHGIEPPAARAAAGKPESGRVTVALRQERNEIALKLSDDGAGLDLEKLRRRALAKGIVRDDQALAEADLIQLVFVSGLSTAETVTELSGRGIGMDVVRNEVSAMGGRVDIATARGKGTTFTIYLPLTLAVTQTVMVRAAGSVLAISSALVEQVLRLKADAMAGLYEKQSVEFQDRSYPLHYLQDLLGAAGEIPIQDYNSVLLLRSGIHRIALHVDELVGNQEIVVKNIGPQLARVPGVTGATVLADGRIALIVNPVQLAQLARGDQAKGPPAPAVAKPAAPVIMVVDDSLTVRKITSRILEREGYQVLTAKDGVDALEQVKDRLPDVILVDIEMPRMDGYDLTKSLRSDTRTRGIPIIIISSRSAEKHRNQASQLGANAFLPKPYQEAELLQAVARHLDVARGSSRVDANTQRRSNRT